MARTSRVRVGIYGVVFHASMALLIAGLGAARGEAFSREFWLVALPAILVSAFVAYLVVVWPYVARRTRRRGVLLYDSAVGMLAECVVAVLTSLLIAAAHATPALGRAGAIAYAGAVAQGTVYGLLWAAADFFIQILIVGNAAGVAGWYVLERIEPKK